jgi:hypothetical protein
MLDLLNDAAVTGLCIVTTAEEMPVNETIDLAGRVKADTAVDLAAVIVNRVLPELFGRGEEAVFERLREPALTAALADATGGPADSVLEAARLAVTLRRTRAGHLERLRQGIEPDLPLLFVPELFTRSHGLRATRHVAEALSAELGY